MDPFKKWPLLQVALEAVVEGAPKALTVCALASERIIVRASNPGQFEQDGGLGGLGGGAGPDGGGAASHHQGPWKTDPAAPDIAYHLGRVGINTDQVRMAYPFFTIGDLLQQS